MRTLIRWFIVSFAIAWVLVCCYVTARIVADVFGDREKRHAPKVQAEGSVGTGRFGKVRGRLGSATIPDGIIIDLDSGEDLEGDLDREQLTKVINGKR